MAKKKFAGAESAGQELFSCRVPTAKREKSSKAPKKDKPPAFHKCYHDHPVIKLGLGAIYGGSASTPVFTTADVYVGLDWAAKPHATWPWAEGPKSIDVYFPVPDMGVPTDSATFKKMVDWLCNQLHESKTIHIGCIGGHGRTGILITAVMAVLSARAYTQALEDWVPVLAGVPDEQMLKDRDIIQWVRKHYCKKAVESQEQIEWLCKNYAVTKAPPSKPPVAKSNGWSATSTAYDSALGYSSYTTGSTYDGDHGGEAIRPFQRSRKVIWSKTA